MIKGKLILYRLFELLVTELAASFLVVALEYLHIYRHRVVMIICVFALLIAFYVINFILSLHLYDFLASVWQYLLFNFSAYCLFGIIHVAVYKFTTYWLYIRTFAITNFMFYSRLNIPSVYSAVIFHGVSFLVMISVPIFLRPMVPQGEMRKDV